MELVQINDHSYAVGELSGFKLPLHDKPEIVLYVSLTYSGIRVPCPSGPK